MYIIYARNYRGSFETGWMPQNVFEDIIWSEMGGTESHWLVPGMYFE